MLLMSDSSEFSDSRGHPDKRVIVMSCISSTVIVRGPGKQTMITSSAYSRRKRIL